MTVRADCIINRARDETTLLNLLIYSDGAQEGKVEHLDTIDSILEKRWFRRKEFLKELDDSFGALLKKVRESKKNDHK